jgi:hypothetical protein
MDNFTIINLQALTGTIAIILGFKWWIQPRIAKLSITRCTFTFCVLKHISIFGFNVYGKGAVL